MESEKLQVRMLGEFSLRLGESEISDNINRSWKVWLLLAYIIYSRNRPITSEEMVTLLWGEEEAGSTNPLNALKTMSHRVRSCLNQLSSNIGHQLILRRNGCYVWNNEFPLWLDIDEFGSLCAAAEETDDLDRRLELWQEALELYQGPFLYKLASEPWVVPIASHYRSLYIQAVMGALPLLEEQGRWSDVVSLSRRAVRQEPHIEEFYRHLMSALIHLGDQSTAVTVYEEMSELLLTDLGVMPSEEARALYHEALRFVNDRAVSPNVILEQLREPSDPGGALFCDYDFFRAIYHSVARLVERSGDSVHLGLISITGADGGELARRSLDRVVENLQDVIRTQLRRGDVAARCSVSQFILLLPQANYENARMVCTRIVKAFCRQYPHSPAELHFSVQPLEPNL